jgi:uncharacterized protein (TIGR02145 family)
MQALFSIQASAQVPSYLPTNGLVAWYPFNGSANDESGNGNNGTVNGATLTEDRFGNANAAYSYDGNSQFIEILNSPSLNPTSISISGWMNASAFATDVAEGSKAIVTKWYQAVNCTEQGDNYSVLLSIQENENRILGVTSINNAAISAISSSSISLNSWNHFVFVHDENGGDSFYLNGSLINQNSFTGALCPTTNNLIIGADNYFSNYWRFFAGSLDDIGIWNRALIPSEAARLYSDGLTSSGNGGGSIISSAPPGIPYQAEVRNESGEVLANANVNIRFTLHELTANGTVSYQETHALTTNDLGLFAATIGAGTAVQGTFATINWSQTTKFLQVEVDTGNGWITMGNQQLLSVPYAMYAANGPAGPAGADGQPGIDGINGRDGVGIYNAYIENGQLFLMLTDNTIISAGSVNNGGGCTNPRACNFNPSYSYDNGSCYYPGYPCDDNNPETQGEVFDLYCQCALAVPGCTNSQACNYNPAANQDDGSCITLNGPCSDGNITTVNDYINEECQCVGFTSISNGTIGNGVTDASGNNYPTVIIGGQEWMAENLRTTKYANGDLIGYNLTASDWNYTQWGAWTNAFERSPGLINVHGNLYNRYAAIDSRNVCPANYHIPLATEWNTLLNNLGSSGNLLWTAPNFGIPGVSGFSGLLTQNTYGFYQGNECASEPPGCMATSYAATDNGGFTYFVLGYGVGYINVGAGGPNYGTPIRCVKD